MEVIFKAGTWYAGTTTLGPSLRPHVTLEGNHPMILGEPITRVTGCKALLETPSTSPSSKRKTSATSFKSPGAKSRRKGS